MSEHTCTACDRRGPWGPTWRWYGSYAYLDAGKRVVKICSDACGKGLSASVLAKLLRTVQADA